jgi:hypothetical protein
VSYEWENNGISMGYSWIIRWDMNEIFFWDFNGFFDGSMGKNGI